MAMKRTTRGERLGQNLTIDNYNIEVVQSFKYLGSTLNVNNSIDEEINTRMLQATRSYYGLRKLIASRYLSRVTKTKLYKTLIRPIATYGCETWTLTTNQELRLDVFERRILRYRFGPVRDESGLWRIRTNEEVYALYDDCSIVSFIKGMRIQWAGHVARMNDSRTVKRVFDGGMHGPRQPGRPRTRWVEDVEQDLKMLQVNVSGWRTMARDRGAWRAVVESAKIPRGQRATL